MIKSYKIRLIPTEEQENLLWLHVNAMRFVWNWGLSLNMERFKQGETYLKKAGSGKILTDLKNNDENFKWLNDVSVQTLSMALIDLDNAYTRFFSTQKKDKKYTDKKVKRLKRLRKKLTPYDMNGHPKFKNKYEAEPKFYTRHDNMYFLKDSVVLEKIGRIGYKTNYELPVVKKMKENTTKYINPRIRYENNKWILSFGIECESTKRELNDFSVGIDLGVKDLAVISYNNGTEHKKFKNINKTKKVKRLKKRLRQKQRNVSRKYNLQSKYKNGSYENSKEFIKTGGTRSAGILKEEAKVKTLHRKLANIRLNYTHHATTEIINLNPKKICIEDLNVTGMMKNAHLSEAIQEQLLHEFGRQIKYKAEWAGIEIVEADRFYPSSKKCSVCGHIKTDLKLKDRVYRCDECGAVIDRDLNAAINLEKLAN